MEYHFTPASERALAEAARWARQAGAADLDAPELLLGLIAESECRAAHMLAARGVDQEAIQRRWPGLSRRHAAEGGTTAVFAPALLASLVAATARLFDYPRPLALATEHLLLGLVAAEHETADWLIEQGFDPDRLETEIHRLYGFERAPVEVESESDEERADAAGQERTSGIGNEERGIGNGEWESLNAKSQALAREDQENERPTSNFQLPTSNDEECGDGNQESRITNQKCSLRLLDASANRAREGLRVVEDYVRFVLDDRHLTACLKQLRHDLTEALGAVPAADLLACRDTPADVGTGLSTAGEMLRRSPPDVAAANFKRLQESLRSLEEFGKLLDSEMARRLEQLRYRAYTLERAVEVTHASLARLEGARLYVLVDGRGSAAEFEALCRPLVDAGVHVLQLRDKTLSDRELLDRARRLRVWTRGTETLFVVNDRPDLALLCAADGVHVGQEELSVGEVRRLVGPRMLVGVSTHSLEQARRAVLDGANYLGVGPTFPSGTKSFSRFTGVELLREVAAEIRLPAFAIGGMTLERLPEVLAAGFCRVAVSGGVAGSADPVAAARRFLQQLPPG